MHLLVARGRLDWQSNDIDGDHVVAMLSERVSDEYLARLRERRVSYLLAGARDVDLSRALEKISDRFGVRTWPGDILWLRYRVEPKDPGAP